MINYTHAVTMFRTGDGVPINLDIRMASPMTSYGGYNWWWAIFNREDAENLADKFEELAKIVREQGKELKSEKEMDSP